MGPSRLVASELQALRESNACDPARIWLVDADVNAGKAHSLGVWTSPSLLFYVGSRLLRVRRAHVDDDTKFVGSISRETVIDLLKQAAECAKDAESNLITTYHEQRHGLPSPAATHDSGGVSK